MAQCRLVPEPLPSLTEDPRFEAFFSAHECVYCIPQNLLEALAKLSGFLTDGERRLENEWAKFCLAHGALGFFGAMPISQSALFPEPAATISREQFREMQWDRSFSYEQMVHSFSLGLERIQLVTDRAHAYLGWLICNSQLLKDRDQLRQHWGQVIGQCGTFPRYPVRPQKGGKGKSPKRKARDVTEDYARDFNQFFERWQLQGLTTWDIPLLPFVNLAGLPGPKSITPPSPPITLQVPHVVALPASVNLREIVEESRSSALPKHLAGWGRVCEQKHHADLGFKRFKNMFLLDFYRDVILASRYGDRFRGNVEALDRAFGEFLDEKSEDSIKKLRLEIARLRRQSAQPLDLRQREE